MNNIDIYLEELYIQEVELNIPKLDKALVSKIKGNLDPKNPVASLKKISKLVPSGLKGNTVPKVDSYLSSRVKNYDKLKNTASQVVRNSIRGVSPKLSELAGSLLAISSMVSKKSQTNINPEKNLKNNIKDFVIKCRKFGEDYEDEEEKKGTKLRPSDYSDMVVAFAIVSIGIVIIASLITGGWVVFSALAAHKVLAILSLTTVIFGSVRAWLGSHIPTGV